MKIVISDYADSMMPTHEYEKQVLTTGLGNCEVVVHEYQEEYREQFFEVIRDADALLTAFIKIDGEVMDYAPNLKVISINATGYDNVDLAEANKRGIGVCPVGEYCTDDVAEFALTAITALVKNLKGYIQSVDQQHQWRYDVLPPNPRIEEQTLGIIGFGKIGKAVARRAKALGMTVIACDPFIDQSSGDSLGVNLVTATDIFVEADIVTNHMNLNETNMAYFDYACFKKMIRRPYFINMGRGPCVVETDLIRALQEGLLKGAALDVLADETPDLANHPLANRANVILTPHAAFYSQTSITELQRISTQNIVHYLRGEKKQVFKLVSDH